MSNEFELEEQQMKSKMDKFSDSAFPTMIELQYKSRPNVTFKGHSKGLSKREYFAAMAMQGILSNASGIGDSDYWCSWSVKYADALIEALNKESNEPT